MNFRFDSTRFDNGDEVAVGRHGATRAAATSTGATRATLVLDNPWHRSFFVLKLWSYFVPSPPNAATQAALESLYVSSGRSIGAVVEAILMHPDVYRGAPLVKPPAVYNAGLLRATGQTITTEAWIWLGDMSGQMLFYPPNVSGWNDRAWLDTSSLYGRWGARQRGPAGRRADVGALLRLDRDRRRRRWRPRSRTSATRRSRRARSPCCRRSPTSAIPAGESQASCRALRQNALRILVATSPDYQVS